MTKKKSKTAESPLPSWYLAPAQGSRKRRHWPEETHKKNSTRPSQLYKRIKKGGHVRILHDLATFSEAGCRNSQISSEIPLSLATQRAMVSHAAMPYSWDMLGPSSSASKGRDTNIPRTSPSRLRGKVWSQPHESAGQTSQGKKGAALAQAQRTRLVGDS